jgi:hypothetical protein
MGARASGPHHERAGGPRSQGYFFLSTLALISS